MLFERQIRLGCHGRLFFLEVEIEGFATCLSDFVNGVFGDDLDALFDVNGCAIATTIRLAGHRCSLLPVLTMIFVNMTQWWHFKFILISAFTRSGNIGGLSTTV